MKANAAVSLLILGEEGVRKPVLEWLRAPTSWERRVVLEQLTRVRRTGLLEFARRAIEAIADDDTLDPDTRKPASALRKRFSGQ